MNAHKEVKVEGAVQTHLATQERRYALETTLGIQRFHTQRARAEGVRGEGVERREEESGRGRVDRALGFSRALVGMLSLGNVGLSLF